MLAYIDAAGVLLLLLYVQTIHSPCVCLNEATKIPWLTTAFVQKADVELKTGADPGYSEGGVRLTIAALCVFVEQPIIRAKHGKKFTYAIFSYHEALS